jgi:hypothetical protein
MGIRTPVARHSVVIDYLQVVEESLQLQRNNVFRGGLRNHGIQDRFRGDSVNSNLGAGGQSGHIILIRGSPLVRRVQRLTSVNLDLAVELSGVELVDQRTSNFKANLVAEELDGV